MKQNRNTEAEHLHVSVGIAKPLLSAGLSVEVILQEQNTIYFMQVNGEKEILKLCENGDIFVKGKLAENDKEVVNALREFLKGQGFF